MGAKGGQAYVTTSSPSKLVGWGLGSCTQENKGSVLGLGHVGDGQCGRQNFRVISPVPAPPSTQGYTLQFPGLIYKIGWSLS